MRHSIFPSRQEMPGVVDVSGLSSNWKKLQQTLRAAPEKDAKDKGVKRKREGETFAKSTRDPNNPNILHVSKKRVKTGPSNSSRPVEKKRMGAAFSTSTSATDKRSQSASVTMVEANIASTNGHSKSVANGRPSTSGSTETLVNQGLHPRHKPGKYLALDCEMVGTGPPPAAENVLARVSIVNFHGEQVYDTYVQPLPGVEVTDYRTFVSGIQPHHLSTDVARPFADVQKEVGALLEGKVLVGHALKNDLAVLLLSHPQRDIRDTARHANFRKISMGRAPALRKLAKERLGLEIQGGEHSSVEDARATMLLFKLEKDVFEKEVQQRYGPAMRRERKTKELKEIKEAEAKQAPKAMTKQRVEVEADLSHDEEDDDSEADLEDEGTAKEAGKKKRKNKKKKRTKRA